MKGARSVKVIVNAISAKMGGALAYLRNFLPTLARVDSRSEYVVITQRAFADEFRRLADNIRIETSPYAERGERQRLVFDQWHLRRLARSERASALFSTANFGVLYPPVPQVTSVRNPVYFCRDYYAHVRDVEGRAAAWKVGARRRLVALSCASSKIVVTPTAAMRDMMLEWGAADASRCVVINHGFDLENFLSMTSDRDERIEAALEKKGDEKLLFYPSLYGKHKNFDTLMEGLGVLVARGRNVRLILTCNIDAAASPYERRTRGIMAKAGVEDRVTLLGPVPYRYMPRIYAADDVVVWPTFAESFGHPLLEAMASKRPIVSSDLPVNREMAGNAAVYFDTFSPEGLAGKVEEALESPVEARLVREGSRRVADFSWRRHVEAFVEVFRKLSGEANE
jgi:glycosyltransferase involved in cell wall biosynthesis